MATSTTAPRRNCKISSTGSGDRSGSEATPPAQVPSRLAGIDGEFIAVFLDKRSTVTTVITDALGRLPIYIGTHEEGVCLSRGLEVAADAGTPDREYDRLAIAQRLCFGYPLGTRTALENVRKPRPAAWIAFRPAGELTTEQHHTVALDGSAYAGRSRQRNARELARLFEESCRSRASAGERPVLSLSGGLDSRAVLGGLVAAGIECEAATIAGERVAAADVEITRKLAALYDVPWTEVSLPPRSGEGLPRYIALRSGRITLSNADILPFFDRLRSELGSIGYLTGDGGDKLLPDPSPISALSDGSIGTDADAEELAAFLTEHHTRLSPADATAIAGLPDGAIEAATARRIGHYPESGSDAYLRFLFAERAYNLLFEGEERNWCSSWSTSPFYSLPFVRYAMGVPRRQKRDYRLYDDFLRALSPDGRLLPVRNPAFNARHGPVYAYGRNVSNLPAPFGAARARAPSSAGGLRHRGAHRPLVDRSADDPRTDRQQRRDRSGARSFGHRGSAERISCSSARRRCRRQSRDRSGASSRRCGSNSRADSRTRSPRALRPSS